MKSVELAELERLRLDQNAWRREYRSHMDLQRIFSEEERDEQRTRVDALNEKLDRALTKLDSIHDRDMAPVLKEVLKSVLDGQAAKGAADRQGYWNHRTTVFMALAGVGGGVVTWLLGKI